MIILVSCEQQASKSLESNGLARIGDATITVQEFSNSYQAGPSLLKEKIAQPKRSFLDAMIREELIAEMLKNDSSYTQYPAIVKALKLLEQELLVEHMFKEEVHDKVQVTDTEIRNAILQSSLSIKAKYLVTQDRQFAVQCLEELDAGVEFDSLLNNPVDFTTRAYLDSTDFLKSGELELPLNEILFKLHPQAYSEVITFGDSYIIFQNVAMIKEIIAEGDIIKYHDRFHKILMYKKRLANARRFVKEFMDPLEIEVAGESFVLLVNALYELYVNLPYEQKQLPQSQAENQELPSQDVLNLLQEHGHDPAVRFSGGSLSVAELLDQVLLKPFHIEATDKQSFAKELNGEIAIALRDYFMEREAMARGYDQDLKIQNELQQWSEKLLVQNYISELKSAVIISEDEVAQHLGPTTVNGDARWKQAEQQLINLKVKLTLDQQVDSLMSQIDLIINEQLLKSIEVDLPTGKQQPDAYLFKLGLPYLRSAFPTPDPIWGMK